jgi:hypothetical protein
MVVRFHIRHAQISNLICEDDPESTEATIATGINIVAGSVNGR